MKRPILVLFAHPAPRRSEVNRPLVKASRTLRGVTVVDLYALYPTLDINVEVEQARLRAHSVVVFMFPLYWYSTPAILKEWQDLVLEYGFAYGEGGDALHEKIFLCAVTAAAREDAFRPEGYNKFSLRQILTPLEQTANLCGMTYLPPFALYGARSAVEDGRLPQHVAQWGRLVDALHTGRLDIEKARGANGLNDGLDALLREV